MHVLLTFFFFQFCSCINKSDFPWKVGSLTSFRFKGMYNLKYRSVSNKQKKASSLYCYILRQKLAKIKYPAQFFTYDWNYRNF